MNKKERKSIFIDTNILAPLNLLFITYDSLKIAPASYFDNLGDFKNELNKRLPDIYETKALETGFRAWKLLKNALSVYDIDLYYSCFSDIEFRDILINQKFHEYLSKEGFCYRVFKKRPLKNQVFFSYANDIDPVCKKMQERLEDLGLNIKWCENEGNSSIGSEIYDMLIILSHYVFLDAMDAYFYCLSIRKLCGTFITHDTEFYGVMKNLAEGVDADWLTLRNNIVKDFCTYLPMFNDYVNDGNFLLPLPIDPLKNGATI